MKYVWEIEYDGKSLKSVETYSNYQTAKEYMLVAALFCGAFEAEIVKYFIYDTNI